MLTFGDTVVGVVNVPMDITEGMIESIIVGSFEGGSNYWMGIDNSTDEWKTRPKGEPLATWATAIILDGGKIVIYDCEEGHEESEKWELTLDGILNGIKLNTIHRKWDCDLENGDATTVDCIVQYALFGEIVYG